MVTRKIILSSVDEAVNLFGHLDENIRRIEKDTGVQVFIKHARGAEGAWPAVSVRGAPGKVDRALRMIEVLRRNQTQAGKAKGFNSQIGESRDTASETGGEVYTTSFNVRIIPRTPQQKKYVDLIMSNDIVIAVGPAGTGKTYLAVACALADLKKGRISKIVLTRPVVEAGEKLGFLPGDFYDKVNPYLRPLYDAFYAMLGPEKFRIFRDDETIEIVPIAYMRGRTMNDAFVILDEAQNTTPEQMKMFLTRMGSNSKVVITGDVTQIDLENKKRSGLVDAQKIFENISEIKFVYFTEQDVVRHQLVKKIIKAYEAWESA